jgi:NAD(P)-dependent dehydrogenase (short-subunit alcohol dehydrogenase family)
MKRTLVALTISAFALVSGAAYADTVLITGSNRGLGFQFAKQYAERGYTVIATARSPHDDVELKALAAKHDNVIVEELDVLDEAELSGLAAKYRGKPIDILINNAGVLGSGSFAKPDRDEFNRVMAVNVYGVLAVTAAFHGNVAASEQKKIIGITSPAGTFNIASLFVGGKMAGMPAPGKEAKAVDRGVEVAEGGGFYYGLSKVAVNLAMHKIRNQVRSEGITVGLIAPNAVDTDMLAELGYSGPKTTDSDAIASFIKIIDGMTMENAGQPIIQDGTILDW